MIWMLGLLFLCLGLWGLSRLLSIWSEESPHAPPESDGRAVTLEDSSYKKYREASRG